MNTVIKFLITLLSLCVSQYGFSQSRLNVKAADSLDFIITLNDVKANNTPCLSITLDKLQPGKQTVKVIVPSHPEIVVEQVLTLKKNTSVFYEIEKSKGSYKLVLKSESNVQLTPLENENTTVRTQNNPVPSTEPSMVNENNSALAPDTINKNIMSIEISDADGCIGLVAPHEFDKMMQEVSSNYFEIKKLEMMKGFISQHCIRVEQLRFMMSKLSLEENKLDLLRSSEGHIYDIKNLKLVEEDFFLEKNKARANQINNSGQP